MADFRSHITTSSTLGVAYGTAAYLGFGASLDDCVVAAGLCSVSGMLPDLDSHSGVPVRETLCFVSAVVPMLMIRRLADLGLGADSMVLVAGLIYVGIRFGIGELFKRYTVHRGMWHSIPAALIAGMLAFLVCVSSELNVRLFKSWAVVLGFLSHLLLDELYSIDLRGRRIKRSFGTALKFFGKSRWANFTTYAKLGVLVVLIMGDPTVMQRFDKEPLKLTAARDWFIERLDLQDARQTAVNATAPDAMGTVPPESKESSPGSLFYQWFWKQVDRVGQQSEDAADPPPAQEMQTQPGDNEFFPPDLNSVSNTDRPPPRGARRIHTVQPQLLRLGPQR